MSAGPRPGGPSALSILALPALLGAGAVLVDRSYRVVVRQELRAAADIASAAGASVLDGTAAGMAEAEQAAIRAAARNRAGGAPVRLSEEDVDLGYWDEGQRSFVRSLDPERVDTLRVTVKRGEVQASLARVTLRPP